MLFNKIVSISLFLLTLLIFCSTVSSETPLLFDENLIVVDSKLSTTGYNITSSIPRLFNKTFPLDLEISETQYGDIQYSNTSKALNCYNKLPFYTLIRGLLKEYAYFLLIYYRVRCEANHDYKDGSTCGDLLYLMDLMENKAEILKERLINKKNECFALEYNIISVQARYYDGLGYLGRSNGTVTDQEYLLIERSFIRRIISQYELRLIERTIKYEKYCMSNSKQNSDLDCYQLRLECWLLETELISLGEEQFKRLSRFKRLDHVEY